VRDIANARAKVISFRGSFSRRSGSSCGEPIVPLPGGKTVMAGQLRHSLKVSPGERAPLALPSDCPHAGASTTSAAAAAIVKNSRRSRCIFEPPHTRVPLFGR
jgi:hypothetical protein